MLKQEEYLKAIDGVVKYLEMCQELSGLVVPVEVEYRAIKRSDTSTKSSIAIFCKRCHSELSTTLQYRHCPWCGQKLRYDDEAYNELLAETKLKAGDQISDDILNSLIKQYVKEEKDGNN